MANFMTQTDLNEASKLQKRQQFEEERKKRIFNAKQRTFGLDIDTLERQIAERNKIRQTEAEQHRRYEHQTDMMQKVIHAKELELAKRRRAVENDLNYYRCRFQNKQQSREFDLNDPESIKKSKPARIADDDINLGISSAQIFIGEDLGHSERQRRQREQQRAWLDQQIKERKQAENARLQADRVIYESINARDQRLEDMANSERKVRHQVLDSIQQFNCELARRKREERLRKQKEKVEDDMAEIYNMLSSDMLTENPNVAQSRTNPNKKIAFMYRGMSPQELANFRQAQHQQMLDRKKQETEKQLMDKQWEQYALNMDRELHLKDREMERKRQREYEKLLEENDKLAQEQKMQKDHDKVLHVNRVTPEFFDKFNTTTR
ncbi:RIB43A-like with coiled-coils protein 2 [Stomoxys calcitrans]|uniref:RIB43A-like with coiled-coils protein 2 n=1 Tax=Stomoxys calcitrans TaxID=35570 RepID=UPI0027E3AD48|nr:RIB43A-like with coiled-coils protein 2 [Stomoxys calcitrans]XP_059216505.1 RIB43A-like with coiled-coils protein 2 [Stomoxys calcitrans]